MSALELSRAQVRELRDVLRDNLDTSNCTQEAVEWYASLDKAAGPPEPTSYAARVTEADGGEWARESDSNVWSLLGEDSHSFVWNDLLDYFEREGVAFEIKDLA